MRCERANRIELDAFLLGATGDEGLDAFRAHYPHCADCSAAVADWMALEEALRGVLAETGESASPHPEPEDLAAFAEAPARLGVRVMQIENHLATCASCGSELRLIQGFDPAMWGARSEARRESRPVFERAEARPESGLVDSLREALVGFLEKLRGFDLLAPVPALALAVVVLAGLWLSGALDRWSGPRESAVPQLVEQSAPAPASTAAPDASTQGLLPAPSPKAVAPEQALAQGAPPATTSEAAPSTAPEVFPPSPGSAMPGSGSEAAPVELAQVEGERGGAGKPPVQPATPGATKAATPDAARSEEVLLAAVSELPPPDYATPSGDGDSLVWMRQFGAVRAAPSEARVAARAPGDHTGLTLSRRPRLWWALDRATDRPVQITIVDGESIDPLVRVELPGPHAAGLHAFDLSKHGATLAPDVDYRWFVSIVVDPDRPSRNPVSAGALRVAGPSDARRETLSSADASVRGNRFAELGLWYDAFDFYASLAEAHPEVERIATYRDRLAEVTKSEP
ncbi:MAG: DUF928 domain-containing protein [Deltaproteobacteria bacterium]|nr:DUF928 domain-containing protein [Deltaproteobacteria bacterium]